MHVQVDQSDILAVERALVGIKNGAPKVLTRAFNKTTTGTRTDITDEVAKVLNITKKVIRERVVIKKATWANLTAYVERTGDPVPLSLFSGTRQTMKGVSVQVKRAGSRGILRHAFIATMNSGHIGVFRREVKTGAGAKKWNQVQSKWFGTLPRKWNPGNDSKFRLGIEELTGPRIEDIMADDVVFQIIVKKSDARMAKNIDHELNYLLSQVMK